MKLLATLRDQDVIFGAATSTSQHFSSRIAARAVVFDEHGNVALLRVNRDGYHKLPGGGVDAGEDLATALARELHEEIGCRATLSHEIGRVDEYRNETKLYQQSFCFAANVVGRKGMPSFTASELSRGFQIIWAPNTHAAIALLKADEPSSYEGHFIKHRDLLLLQAAQPASP